MKRGTADLRSELKNRWGMTEEYFQSFDKEDIELHHSYLKKLEGTPHAAFSFRGGNEHFLIHRFDPGSACREITGFSRHLSDYPCLIRIAANNSAPGFMIVSFHRDGQARPGRPPKKGQGVADGRPHYSFELKRGRTMIHLAQSDISRLTLVRNVLETFSAYRIFPSFAEIREILEEGKRKRNHFNCRFCFGAELDGRTLTSIGTDFDRYLQSNIRPMSLFDILGPSMIGPSSSHTAGACRIGQISRNILTALKKGGAFGRIKGVTIKLRGSFRDTGVGHRTPNAIAGGLRGLAPDDGRLMKAGEPEFLRTDPIDMDGDKVSFKGFLKGAAGEDKIYEGEKNSNIAEITAETDRGKFTITGFSIGGGNVEIRYLNNKRLKRPADGKEDISLREMLGGEYPDGTVKKVIASSSSRTGPRRLMFNTFEEVEEYSSRSRKTLLEIALESEKQLQDVSDGEIYSFTGNYWSIMKTGIMKGLKNDRPSLFKLTGGDAKKIALHIKRNRKFDNLFGKAIAYATAVSEMNASSCVIVAAPTAGSCGIIPGVLKAYEETARPPEKKILEALIIAGFFGMVLFDDVTTAGADYGCQAEVGAAAAMASAAMTYLEKGTTSQMIQAFTLALKNSMGLVCDPVAGLVEVPCVKRNGVYTSLAISSAIMALSGVSSFVSPDEVVLAVREVGERLNKDYRETAGGGLAKTRDAKRVELEFQKEVRRFFS